MDIQFVELSNGEVKSPPVDDFGFGNKFSNYMFSQEYTPELGWHGAKIGPHENISLPPSAAVLHYAQEIFEGTKAYRRPDGDVNLFRIWENMKRFNRSARRMAMPHVDEEDHLEAIVELIRVEKDWVPEAEGASLYIRPAMIATDAALGVHASERYLHFVIASPVGAYFKEAFDPVPVFICDNYRRAARGGVGAAKTGGNYAASLLVGEEAKASGYSQVLWLDSVEGRYVEEVGAMNICFVYEGQKIVTPPLSDSILNGVTRDSVLTLAPDLGYEVAEERIEVHQMLDDLKAGKVTEVFGTGTAAVIAPVGKFGYQDEEYLVCNNEPGPVARRLFKELVDIQYGRADDPYGWTLTV